MRYFIFIYFVLFSLLSHSYIPKASTIFAKTAENSGSGIYQIDQEVQFQGTTEPYVLKETWFVDGPDHLKLVVTGAREFKDQIRLVFLYEKGFRHQSVGGDKQVTTVGDDFIEKYFHFRKGEELGQALVGLKIIPASLLLKKPFKPNTDPDMQSSSPFVRLARVDGTIAYDFGTPTTEPSPAFWIEQDQFVIRKFRLPSLAEVSADEYSSYARGLLFPKKRAVRWDDKVVQIQTLNIHSRNDHNIFHSRNLEPSTKSQFFKDHPLRATIEEFYGRFR